MNTSNEKVPDTYYPDIDLLYGLPVILTVTEVSHVWNVSVPTIKRLISRGKISTNCDGEILKEDLIEYIKTHTYANKPVL